MVFQTVEIRYLIIRYSSWTERIVSESGGRNEECGVVNCLLPQSTSFDTPFGHRTGSESEGLFLGRCKPTSFLSGGESCFDGRSFKLLARTIGKTHKSKPKYILTYFCVHGRI